MATRAQLRTYARERADQDAATFPTDTQYNTYLDQAAKEVWYDLLQAGWPVNFSTVTKTATSTSFIPLSVSGTVAAIRGVYFYSSDGTTMELRKLNEGDRAGMLSIPGTDRASRYDYRIDATSGPGIELFPHVSAGSYKVDYILEHPGFSGDSDVWYGPARSDELLVIRAAMKGAAKEQNSDLVRQLMQDYSVLMSQVQAMASWADMRNSASIRDVGNPLRTPRDPFDFDVDTGQNNR